MKTYAKWIVAAMVLGGSAVGGTFWWQARAKTKPAQKVETVAARKGDLRVTVKATGAVEPEVVVEVKSKASGVVQSVGPQEGDSVKAGDLLVKIDPIVEKRKVLQSEAELRMAQAGLVNASEKRAFSVRQADREAGLLKKGLVSAESADTARKEAAVQHAEVSSAAASVLRAREALAEAKDRLTETEIHAPATGTVLERTVQPGQIVASGTTAVNGGTTLLKIADLSKLFVRAKIDESDVARLAVGQKVALTADALPGQRFDGTVARIAPQGKVESNVTVFEILISVGAEGRKVMKPAMTANVEIEISSHKDIVLVPLRAVRTAPELGGKVVTVAGLGSRVVQTGLSDSKMVEIVSGVQEGEAVELPALGQKAAAGGQNGGPNMNQMRRMMGGK